MRCAGEAHKVAERKSAEREQDKRIGVKSLPTIPKAPVKTTSRNEFASDEKVVMHPPRFSATSELVHVLSTTKGGVVLFV